MPFFRFAGIWIVAVWAAPLLGLLFASINTGQSIDTLAMSMNNNVVGLRLLATRLPIMLASLIAFPTVLVAWHRFLLEDYRPRFIVAFPNWRAMRYLFRLWITLILFGILVQLAFSNGPDVARLIGAKDEIVVSKVLFWSILLLEIYLGSSYALVFPAIAVGNKQFGATDGLVIVRTGPNAYRLGFVISLLPLVLICWSANALLDRLSVELSWLTLYSLRAIPLTLLFLSLASCAAYLSDIYGKTCAVPVNDGSTSIASSTIGLS